MSFILFIPIIFFVIIIHHKVETLIVNVCKLPVGDESFMYLPIKPKTKVGHGAALPQLIESWRRIRSVLGSIPTAWDHHSSLFPVTPG